MTRPAHDEHAAARADMEMLAASLRRATEPYLLSHLTLETLITDPTLGAFRPSPSQTLLIRIADGRPFGDLAGVVPPERLAFHLGTAALPANAQRPRLVILRTGVRAGKSFIAAMALLRSILTCEFRRPPTAEELPDADGMVGVRPGELVRALIVAPLLKLSRAPLDHLVGTMRASPRLAPLLVKAGAEFAVIRRPDGREVTVELVAASSGGANLRSTWLAGVIFDEADFHDAEGAAVNLPDNLDAAMPRLLGGAQVWVPSSPWADEGSFHEMFTKAFGTVGRTLAFHSDSRSMNPTLSREDEQAERERNPEKAAREYDAIPYKAGSTLFFPPEAVDRCVNHSRKMHLDPLPGTTHMAGTDLGFRKNSSALAIARADGRRVVLAYHAERVPKPGEPLKPSEVCRDFGAACKRYGAKSVQGDLHYAETAREHLAEFDVHYLDWAPTAERIAAAFTTVRTQMLEGRLELPNDPRLLGQFKKAKMVTRAGGPVTIALPKEGWAHGDLLIAAVLACAQAEARAHIYAPRPTANTYRLPGSQRGFG